MVYNVLHEDWPVEFFTAQPVLPKAFQAAIERLIDNTATNLQNKKPGPRNSICKTFECLPHSVRY